MIYKCYIKSNFSVHKVLLEQSHTYLFVSCLWLCSQVVLMVKNPPANTGDMRLGFSPWVGKIPRGRAWKPPPVFLPAESYGQRNLMGCSPKGCTESDTTEMTYHAHTWLLSLYKSRVKQLRGRPQSLRAETICSLVLYRESLLALDLVS